MAERRLGERAERAAERKMVADALREAEVCCQDCGFTVRNTAIAQGATWSVYADDWLCPRCVAEKSPRERQVEELFRTRERQVAALLEEEQFGVAVERRLVEDVETQLFGVKCAVVVPDDVQASIVAYAVWRRPSIIAGELAEQEPFCLWAAERVETSRRSRIELTARDLQASVERKVTGARSGYGERVRFVFTRPAWNALVKELDKIQPPTGGVPFRGGSLPTEWRPGHG